MFANEVYFQISYKQMQIQIVFQVQDGENILIGKYKYSKFSNRSTNNKQTNTNGLASIQIGADILMFLFLSASLNIFRRKSGNSFFSGCIELSLKVALPLSNIHTDLILQIKNKYKYKQKYK